MNSLFKLFYLYQYRKYKNKNWSIVSSISSNPPTLNIAFPDNSIVYYITSFHSKDKITLYGTIPNNIYFWSITIYNKDGLETNSVADSTFFNLNNQYIIKLSTKYNNILNNNVYLMTCPEGYYSVIMRIYLNLSNPITIIPEYLPIIQGVHVKDVSFEYRIKESNQLESIFQNLFAKKIKNKSLKDIFIGITNFNQFFLPSKNLINLAFPNPFAIYLMLFPTSNNVIKITGKLQPNIGLNNSESIRFISFMACNFSTSATDSSINFSQLTLQNDNSYTLFISYSEENAVEYGYNETNDNLILWNYDNANPVVIYRMVCVFNQNQSLNNNLFTIDNSSNVSYDIVQNTMGIYYPVATCY
jgi:hypothetical protein